MTASPRQLLLAACAISVMLGVGVVALHIFTPDAVIPNLTNLVFDPALVYEIHLTGLHLVRLAGDSIAVLLAPPVLLVIVHRANPTRVPAATGTPSYQAELLSQSILHRGPPTA